MARESYIFYASFYEAMKYLPDADYVAVSKAINEYALYGNEIELSGIATAFFQLIKPQIDANNRRRDAGLKGGAPRGNSNAAKQPKADLQTTETTETKQPELNFETTETADKNNQKQPNYNVNDNDNVNENVNDNVFGGNSDFAAADAATQPSENNSSSTPIEESASPNRKEKGCAEKEKKSIDDRAADFCQEVMQNYGLQYPQQMIDEFCSYWTEHNESGVKLRFEAEKFFNIKRRLAYWASREKQSFKPASRPTAAQSPAASNSVDEFWKTHDY